jgi:biopolymer transport protein ExbB
MSRSPVQNKTWKLRRRSAVAATLILACAVTAAAQQPAQKDIADQQFDAAMATEPAPAEIVRQPATEEGLNLLEMASPQVGGIFMYPIYVFSFVVVLFGIERAIGLRRRKVLPRKLVRGLNDMLAGQGTSFDPRQAWRLCQKYPSAASRVIRATLLQTGRSQPELEATLHKASEREATRLYANVRPLNLSATVAPLLGLVGTVQGMILAFYETAHLPDGANKAQALAAGVYIALITTFAGLCVAIPAVMLAHYFEGKIQRLFGQLEDITTRLVPALQRYEGRVRMGFSSGSAHDDEPSEIEPARKTAAPASNP